MDDKESQEDELIALASIYDDESFCVSKDDGDAAGGYFSACLELPTPFYIKLDSDQESKEGEKSEISHEVQYLPPIQLNFQFPAEYPSRSPPQFTLSCKWLSLNQLTKLCQKLDEIWDENKGEVILFLWTNLLKNESIEILDITSPLNLNNACDKTRKNSRDKTNSTTSGIANADEIIPDSRAIQDIGCHAYLLPTILEYNKQRRRAVFDKTLFTCDVCFAEKFGSLCLQFADCEHVFCDDCMKGFFEVQINEGNVKALTCPHDKCETQALPWQVKRLVSPELFQKYDRLLLQVSLDTMTDIVYCPRPACQSAVILDPGSNMGCCAACNYVFCTLCQLTYHGVSPCRVKRNQLKKLRDEYLNADSAGKLFLEKRYGKRAIETAMEEIFSQEWLEEFSKQCPECGTYIQKIDGCNKMTCIKCRGYFCWICSRLLSRSTPYNHYQDQSSECFNRLFEGMDLDNDDDDDDFGGDNWRGGW
ncbi:E3 ubiquitin-protein ligase RNF14-like [Tubulanus polymorphus]|uniref:E3 ubiquitin-protein ligase RNF14-like n=1 Tax=Tubulanus polymorphus TaxID=672921 RepID=UPI003DA62F77